MNIADVVSTRSLDPDSKFGCIAVGSDNAILSTGYNGPPRQVNDDDIPLTRPDKYIYFEHSERNCIYNAARKGISLEGCTFYVTGISCIECTRAMYQVGAKRIVMRTSSAYSYEQRWQDFIDYIESYIVIDYF